MLTAKRSLVKRSFMPNIQVKGNINRHYSMIRVRRGGMEQIELVRIIRGISREINYLTVWKWATEKLKVSMPATSIVLGWWNYLVQWALKSLKKMFTIECWDTVKYFVQHTLLHHIVSLLCGGIWSGAQLYSDPTTTHCYDDNEFRIKSEVKTQDYIMRFNTSIKEMKYILLYKLHHVKLEFVWCLSHIYNSHLVNSIAWSFGGKRSCVDCQSANDSNADLPSIKLLARFESLSVQELAFLSWNKKVGRILIFANPFEILFFFNCMLSHSFLLV